MIQWLFALVWRLWRKIPQRRRFLRIILWLLSVLVSFAGFLWCFVELLVYYEMISTGAQSRAELGEDLGLGFLVMLVAFPATVLSVLVFAFYSWAWFSRKLPDENAQLPNPKKIET